MATGYIKNPNVVGNADIYMVSNAIAMPWTLTLPNNSRHMLIINGPYSARGIGIVLANCNASGVVQACVIGGVGIGVATDTNTLTISDSTGAVNPTTSQLEVITTYGSRITM